MSKDKKQIIKDLQKNTEYVILNNPLANPKFIRLIGRGKEVTINDTYTPKIFYEIVSKLTHEDLSNVDKNESIVLEIHIKDFLESISANTKNYKHFIESVDIMQSNLLRWKEGEEIVTTSIITKSRHNPNTGKVELYVDSELAKRILEIKEDGNFSFLKSNVFKLQNAQAIKLYPFFKSWLNSGKYQTDLERFKAQFGYNTSGYKYWSNLETKVLIPAVEEINVKTDIRISYKATGESLESKKPRIKGIQFFLHKNNNGKTISTINVSQDEPQVDIIKENVTSDKIKEVDELYLILKKIQIEDRPPETNSKIYLESLVDDLGYKIVKDGLLGILESKAKAKSIAFFNKKNLLKYPNYESKKQEIDEKNRLAKEQELENIKKQRLIEEIKSEYEKAKSKFFKETFEKLDQESKDRLIEELWNSTEIKAIYFKPGVKDPNTYGINWIAQKVAFPKGYDYKQHLKHHALKNWKIQLDFNEKDEIVLKHK